MAASLSGCILWKVFLALDSSRYPMISFGDTYFRVYGPNFILIMIACSHFGIDYQAVISSTRINRIEAVKRFAGPRPDQYQQQATGFTGQFNGVDQLVYSWGGAILFIAFLAEM
ncbi:hypothetical protein EYZ11_011127 [Aspergillus tanneri]|uniref:Uncharacterized protein n=1 Tax=Aspergillus tanneri TaxID=1220188 RepID=A0A4S3J3K7_9EURO|nr:hypothetical protein EYZ11_011127 [Aspergillus tanneri]